MPTVVDFVIDGPSTPASLIRSRSEVIGFAAVDEQGVARVVTDDFVSELAQITERVYLDSVLGIAAEFALDVPQAARYDDVRALHHVLGDKLPRALKQPPASGNPYDACRVRAEQAQEHFLALHNRLTQRPSTAYREIELPAIMAAVAMMRDGLHVDREYLGRLKEELQQQLGVAASRLEEVAGREVDFRRVQAIREYVFDDLALPVCSVTSSGEPVLNDLVLDRLAADHDVPRHILACRRLQKCVTLAGQIANQSRADQRIHPHLDPIGTSIGRFKCASPDFSLCPPQLRDAIVASPDNVLVEVNVAQADIRLWAHLRYINEWRDAFAQGADVHRTTAAAVFSKSVEEITADERETAKQLTFQVLGGVQPERVADELRISTEQAEQLLETYRATHLRVVSGLDSSFYDALMLSDIYVETVWGRKRQVRAVRSGSGEVLYRAWCRASRRANQFMVQGSAADLIKWVVVQLFAGLPSDALPIMIEGDRILLDMPESRIEETAELTRAALGHVPVSLRVPFVAEIRVGRRWGSLSAWSPEKSRDGNYEIARL